MIEFNQQEGTVRLKFLKLSTTLTNTHNTWW